MQLKHQINGVLKSGLQKRDKPGHDTENLNDKGWVEATSRPERKNKKRVIFRIWEGHYHHWRRERS